MEKHCNTCEYSFDVIEKNLHIPEGVKMQHCGSFDYNSPAYTHKMLMEDRGKGYCRFWAPKIKEDNTL